MTVSSKIDTFKANGDLYRLDREIIKQESLLRELRLEMFVKLISTIDIEHPEKTEKRLLSRLFNICRELADEDDPRAKYWLAMFYGGKLGTAVVGPEYRKAILYINGVGGRLPIYNLAVEVCEYFGKHRNALTYAMQGVVSADILLSDMQFDKGTRSSDTGVFESMKKLYKENGYKLPSIIFWNVNARYQTIPVTKHETGAITVSGFSKNIFKIVQNNDFEFSPEAFMLNVLNSERYKDISLANITTKPPKEKASKEKSKKACGDSKSQKAASGNPKKDFKKKPQNFKKKSQKN